MYSILLLLSTVCINAPCEFQSYCWSFEDPPNREAAWPMGNPPTAQAEVSFRNNAIVVQCIHPILSLTELMLHTYENFILTIMCLLCFSIQCISCACKWNAASYHILNIASTPDGGHCPFSASATGASMLKSMLQRAWWNSDFFLCGVRVRGFAFAMKAVDAFNPLTVLTCHQLEDSMSFAN